MPPKRASVPTNAFGSGARALDKLTGRSGDEHSEPQEQSAPPTRESNAATRDNSKAAKQQNSNTLKRENGKTVKQKDGNAVKMSRELNAQAMALGSSEQVDDSSTREKVTFYLRPDQIEKLDDLVIAYKRQTGRRANRNALMRLLLDRVDIDLLVGE